MAHKSYRKIYLPINKNSFPWELAETLKQIFATNQKRIVELLLKKPEGVNVGKYNREDRNIHFRKPSIWELNSKFCLVHAVPQISVISAISNINLILKKKKLSFSIWAECKIGNPLNKKGKVRIYKDEAPFKIGLVDKNCPIKPSGN